MHRSVLFAAVAALAAACASPSAKPAASAAASSAPAAVAAAAPAPAAAPAAPQPAPAPALPTGTLATLSGVASAVDPAAGTVTVSAKGTTRVLRVAEGAKLTKGGDWARIDLKAVAAGDRVSARYQDGVLASLHVKVSGPAAQAKVASAKTASPKDAKTR
jgi:hypothetical protein